MNEVLRILEQFGNRYVSEHLGVWRKNSKDLVSDWFKALDFFLSRAYFQGRRDELSERFYENAKSALITHFGNNSSGQTKKLRIAWDEGMIPHSDDWQRLKNSTLETALLNAKAGKARDVEMVLDVLRFIHPLPKFNIVSHSLTEIREGRIGQLYAEIDSIWQIGQKVSSFFLRDLAFIFNLNLSPQEFFTIQPIDTWVKQVAINTGICISKTPDHRIVGKIVDACNKAGVDPKKVNAGAWYLGANSFEILLDAIKGGTFHP